MTFRNEGRRAALFRRRTLLWAGPVGLAAWALGRRWTAFGAPDEVRISASPEKLTLLPTKRATEVIRLTIRGLDATGLAEHRIEIRVAPKDNRMIGNVVDSAGREYPDTWRARAWLLDRFNGDQKFADTVALGAAVAPIVTPGTAPDYDEQDSSGTDVWKSSLTLKPVAETTELGVRGFSLGGFEPLCAADKLDIRLVKTSDPNVTVASCAVTVESQVPGLVKIEDELMRVEQSAPGEYSMTRLIGSPGRRDWIAGLRVKPKQRDIYARPDVIARLRMLAHAWRQMWQTWRPGTTNAVDTMSVRPTLVVTEGSMQWGGVTPSHRTHRTGLIVDLRYPSVAPANALGLDPAPFPVHCAKNPDPNHVDTAEDAAARDRYSFEGSCALLQLLQQVGAHRALTADQNLVKFGKRLTSPLGDQLVWFEKSHFNHLHVEWGDESLDNL